MRTKLVIFCILILIYTTYTDKRAIEEAKEKLVPITQALYQPKAEAFTGTYKSSLPNGQAITIYGKQLEELKKRGYSNTRILDLLTIKSLECNSYTSCEGIGGADIGPFQINQIHKEQFAISWDLHNEKEFAKLFLYQLSYANLLVQSYEEKFCDKESFDFVGLKYTNEARFKCIAVSYNGSPRYKKAYMLNGWEKRKRISEFLFTNNYLVL